MDNNYETYQKFFKLFRLLHRFYHTQNKLNPGKFINITQGQGRVLSVLQNKSEISAKDLARILDIRQQSLNEQLNKLERGGYIKREPSQKDKRVIMISLTKKGKDTNLTQEGTDKVFDCLSKEEIMVFEEYLDRIIAGLEEKLNRNNKTHTHNHHHRG